MGALAPAHVVRRYNAHSELDRVVGQRLDSTHDARGARSGPRLSGLRAQRVVAYHHVIKNKSHDPGARHLRNPDLELVIPPPPAISPVHDSDLLKRPLLSAAGLRCLLLHVPGKHASSVSCRSATYVRACVYALDLEPVRCCSGVEV